MKSRPAWSATSPAPDRCRSPGPRPPPRTRAATRSHALPRQGGPEPCVPRAPMSTAQRPCDPPARRKRPSRPLPHATGCQRSPPSKKTDTSSPRPPALGSRIENWRAGRGAPPPPPTGYPPCITEITLPFPVRHRTRRERERQRRARGPPGRSRWAPPLSPPHLEGGKSLNPAARAMRWGSARALITAKMAVGVQWGRRLNLGGTLLRAPRRGWA